MSKFKKLFTTPIKPLYLYSAVLVILLLVYVFADIDKYVPPLFSKSQSKQTLHAAPTKESSQSLIISAESKTTEPTAPDIEIDDIEISATGDWNMYNWSFDEAIEARVLKPYTLNDLKQFGIEFQISEKDKSARFNISSDGIIEQKIVPFNEFKNISIKRILLDKTAEVFAAQENESRRLIAEGYIKDTNVMHEFGDSYHVPIKIINEVKNSFKEMPEKFITIYEVPLYGEVKAIIGKITIAFTGKHYHFEEETHTVESTFFFMITKDQEIAMHEFARSSGYAFFKNKEGQVYFLLKQSGYEGSGLESYLVNSDELKLTASVGAGV